MEEAFKPVPNHYPFEVSESGTVRNIETKFTYKPSIKRKGYLCVSTTYLGKRVTCLVHRAVAYTYLPNPEGRPQVNHIDCDKSNNNLYNLEWCTCQENIDHAILNNLHVNPIPRKGEDQHNAKITESQARSICELLSSGVKIKDIAAALCIKAGIISEISRGLTWKHVSCNYNITVDKFSRSKLSEDEIHNLCRLILEGKTTGEILKVNPKYNRTHICGVKKRRAFKDILPLYF